MFGKAIFCLAKLGDDLYIEAQSDGVSLWVYTESCTQVYIFVQLALKTVNNARSAYACFLFHKSFFLSYNERGVVLRGGAEAADDGTESLKCKISNRVCCNT